MEVHELIAAFAPTEKLPIDVNDVLRVLRERGCDDDIEFVGVDLDTDILQGAIKVFHVRNGVYVEPTRLANIYYHRGLSRAWQRFICCKELIHLLDPPSARIKNSEEARMLAEKMGLPPEMQDPLNDGLATNVDRLAEWRAAALLFPKGARDLLLEPLQLAKLKPADIARLVDIPGRYAGFVMSPIWPQVYDLLTTAMVVG